MVGGGRGHRSGLRHCLNAFCVSTTQYCWWPLFSDDDGGGGGSLPPPFLICFHSLGPSARCSQKNRTAEEE